MADYHFIDDDSEASDDDAERYPDAVYDADDPEWRDILSDDEERADYDDSGDFDLSDFGSPEEWGWDDWPEDFDGEYYEVELGIDYGEDT